MQPASEHPLNTAKRTTVRGEDGAGVWALSLSAVSDWGCGIVLSITVF